MNINLLKGHIRAAGMSQEDVAKKMNVSLSRFNAKLNLRGGANFDLWELCDMRDILHLSAQDTFQIFFQ